MSSLHAPFLQGRSARNKAASSGGEQPPDGLKCVACVGSVLVPSLTDSGKYRTWNQPAYMGAFCRQCGNTCRCEQSMRLQALQNMCRDRPGCAEHVGFQLSSMAYEHLKHEGLQRINKAQIHNRNLESLVFIFRKQSLSKLSREVKFDLF